MNVAVFTYQNNDLLNLILVTCMYTVDSVSETSVSGEVIVNSLHNVIIVWTRLHVNYIVINC